MIMQTPIRHIKPVNLHSLAEWKRKKKKVNQKLTRIGTKHNYNALPKEWNPDQPPPPIPTQQNTAHRRNNPNRHREDAQKRAINSSGRIRIPTGFFDEFSETDVQHGFDGSFGWIKDIGRGRWTCTCVVD